MVFAALLHFASAFPGSHPQHHAAPLLLGAVALAVVSCKKPEPPAPTPAARDAGSRLELSLDPASSIVKFEMLGLEKIRGTFPGGASGSLAIDLADLSKTTASIRMDLNTLALTRQSAILPEAGPREPGSVRLVEFGERHPDPVLSESARRWLELAPNGAAPTTANRFAEYSIEKVDPSERDLRPSGQTERSASATAYGDLQFRGKKVRKVAKLSLSFRYNGPDVESVTITSFEPFKVDLAEFAVHPRDASGKVTKTVTEALATDLQGKLFDAAVPITVSLTARP